LVAAPRNSARPTRASRSPAPRSCHRSTPSRGRRAPCPCPPHIPSRCCGGSAFSRAPARFETFVRIARRRRNGAARHRTGARTPCLCGGRATLPPFPPAQAPHCSPLAHPHLHAKGGHARDNLGFLVVAHHSTPRAI